MDGSEYINNYKENNMDINKDGIVEDHYHYCTNNKDTSIRAYILLGYNNHRVWT